MTTAIQYITNVLKIISLLIDIDLKLLFLNNINIRITNQMIETIIIPSFF